MNAFLGRALKLDLDVFWRFVHALLNAFGGSKFEGLIWKKMWGGGVSRSIWNDFWVSITRFTEG